MTEEEQGKQGRRKKSISRKARHKFKKIMEERAIISAHQKKSRRQEKSAEKKVKLTANQKMLATFVCTLVGLTILSIYFRGQILPKRADEGVVVSDLELVLSEASTDELIIYAKSLEQQGMPDELPAKISFIKKQISIAERMEQLESESGAAATMLNTVKQKRLSLITRLNKLHRQHSLGAIDEDLHNYVLAHARHEDTDVRRQANLCICFTSIENFLGEPNSLTFDAMRNQVDASLVEFREDEETTRAIASVLRQVPTNELDARFETNKMFVSLGSKLRGSSLESVRAIGDSLMQYPLLSSFDFESFTINSELGDEKAIALGLDFVKQVASQKAYGPRAYLLATYILEMLDRQGRKPLTNEVSKSLIASVDEIENRFTASESSRVVEAYKKRSSLVGVRIDPTVFRWTDSARTKLIVIYDLNYHSYQTIETVKSLPATFADDGLEVSFVHYLPEDGMSVIPPWKDFGQELVERSFEASHHLTGDAVDKVLDICPVQQGPYLLLLDQDNEVLASNVSNDKLRTLIADLTNSN